MLTEDDVENLDRLLISLAGLSEVSAEITTNPNLKGSMRTVLRMIKGTFAVSKAALFQSQPESKRLMMLAGIGVDELGKTLHLALPERTERYWIANHEPVEHPTGLEVALSPFINGHQNETLLKKLPNTLWVPLVMKAQFFGLLMLSEKLGGHAYSPTEVSLLGIIARQIAVALYNHDLKFKLDLKIDEMERLHEITGIIHGTLQRQTITRELVSNAVSLLTSRRGILMNYDPNTEEFEMEAAFGFSAWPQGKRFPQKDLWLEDVVLSGESKIWADPLEIPAELDSFACLAVPVKGRDKVLGVLAVFDKEAGMGIGPFSEDDQRLLMSLSGNAGASIENATLYELATVDGLTKLYIRRHFEQRFGEETRRAVRYNSPLSLMMCDIDHFKKFNDTYGHATGDEVLKLVAQTIKRNVRDLDIPARYGGEEMLVLMPETDREGAMRLAERIRHAIATTDLPGPHGSVLHVTISIGVATLPEHGTTEEVLMARSDEALYRSKHAGRNRVTLWEPEASAQEVS